MQKAKYTEELLLLLMTQADNEFMSLDFDNMTEEGVKESYDDWSRLILFYENLYQPFNKK